MNIVRDTSRNAEVVSVPCLVCGRMLRLADAWIDTDGPAFRAYYHAACLPTPTSWGEMTQEQHDQTYEVWFASELPEARKEHTPEGFPHDDDIEDAAQDGLEGNWAFMLDEQKFEIAKTLGILQWKRCNRCHRPMTGTTAYDGACECGGLIEAAP